MRVSVSSLHSKEIKQRSVTSHIPSFDSCVPVVIQRLLLARGISSDEELNRDLSTLIPAHFNDLQKSLLLLSDAIYNHRRILIIGDFDVDGATSTSLAVLALKSFGAQKVNYLVPNRFQFGYGLSPEIVEVAIRDFAPDLIVTVDNGITNIAGVAKANLAGIKVIVTDHHLPGELLPEAAAIINPNHPSCTFPSKNLAGVGVIFYVMVALRTFLREQGWFRKGNIPEPNIAQFLDLVALGTIADMVPLDKNNRTLVYHGLKRIRAGFCRQGIKALLAVAQKNIAQISAQDLAFAVAPRLNAAGRLEDMSHGIECLLCESEQEATEFALTLDSINQERKKIEKDMKANAEELIEEIQHQGGELPYGLCLFAEDWHQGVIGLVASKIKEKVNRPVIAFACDHNEKLKGSARSISGLHIRDVLCHINALQPGLIEKFGGHAMAGGLTIKAKDLALFSDLFNQAIVKLAPPDVFDHVIWTDGMLEENELSLVTAELINNYGPWGQHFPEPQFHGVFQIREQKILNGQHLKWILSLPDLSNTFEAIAFFVSDIYLNQKSNSLHLVYRLNINQFAGKRKLQLMVDHIDFVAS